MAAPLTHILPKLSITQTTQWMPLEQNRGYLKVVLTADLSAVQVSAGDPPPSSTPPETCNSHRACA